MARKTLITGITGQDGSYLAEFLLAKGYEVHGMVCRSSTESSERIDGCAAKSLSTKLICMMVDADLERVRQEIV